MRNIWRWVIICVCERKEILCLTYCFLTIQSLLFSWSQGKKNVYFQVKNFILSVCIFSLQSATRNQLIRLYLVSRGSQQAVMPELFNVWKYTSQFLIGYCGILIVLRNTLHSKKSSTGFSQEEKLSSHRHALAWFGSVNLCLTTGKQQRWDEPAPLPITCLVQPPPVPSLNLNECSDQQRLLWLDAFEDVTLRWIAFMLLKCSWYTFTLLQLFLNSDW